MPPKKRNRPINVRGDLVGEEDAEQLHVEDDRTQALATMVFGLVLLALSVVVLVQAVRLDNGGNAVGPATVPWVLGGSLLVVGVLTTVRGRRDMGVWEVSEHTSGQDWKRLGLLLAALVVFAIVVPFLGYVVSGTLLYGVTAIALGAPHRSQMFAVGFSVSAVVWLLFDVGIGISLPAGPWGF
ncbi:tripartite tricarboxylate transporter TctB family protein [Nocardioides sp. GXQ0305]|uniref:tripartite tricarboxylate transporter TctB family protein n=1 Tax=Nocardioides sp. GXQ0305 TaxID=3423912 RepID=UPI003D7D8905